MKISKLKVGDFFHVEVVEIQTSNEGDKRFKLDVKDGPIKGHLLYFHNLFNPHIEEEIELF